MGAVQLLRFGATIYVADLVALAMVREMGAVMTAVVMAGRTGAAFAAQLGTMKVTEEIDALRTLGVSRRSSSWCCRASLALVLMMPLLCLYADFWGIVGGVVVAAGMLDLTMTQYLNETFAAATLTDVALGVGKSVVFGGLIARGELLPGHAHRRQRLRRGRLGDRGGGERHRADHRDRRPLRGALQRAGDLSVETAAPAAGAEPHIVVRDLTLAFGDFVLMRDLELHGAPRLGVRDHGRERLRQERAAAPHAGPARAGAGRGALPTARASRAPDRRSATAMLRRIGILYQRNALWSSMTLAENVALPLREYTELSAAEIREVVALKLALVGPAGLRGLHCPARSAAACRSAPASPAPWLSTPRCCSSTSRPRASTR